MLFSLNKNYLFRFDNSILSKSVTVKHPFLTNLLLLLQHIPIITKFFIYSHPIAPAPIKKMFKEFNYLEHLVRKFEFAHYILFFQNFVQPLHFY